MSQGTFPLSCSQSGQLFSDDLNSLLKGINSTNSGTTAPSSGLEEGVLWLDTSEAATPVLKIYDASVPGFIVLGVNGDSFKTVVIYKNSLVTPTPVPSSTNTVLNGTLDGFTAGGNTQSWSLTQTTPGTGADTYTSIGTFEQANSIGEYTTVGDWSTPAQLSGNDGSTGARSPIIGFYVPMVTRVIGTPTTFTSVLANFNPDGLLGTNTDNQAYLDASFSQFFFGNLTSDAVEGDYGVFYNNSVETENLVASYDAASGNWITGTKKISGNLLVDGSITADAISATAITGKIVKGGKNALDDITPSGFFFNSDGEFIIGGGSENIVFNGTNLTVPALTITGELVASQIAAGTITANEIATGTITATQLSADSITADKIASLELSVEKKLSVGNIKVGAEDELGAATVVSATSIEILDTGDFPTSGTVLIGGTESFTYTSKNADGVTFNSTTDTVEAVFAAGTVVQEVITGYAITFGTGVVLDGSGKFAVGSVDESLVFDGTNLVLSGVPIDANDLVEVASLNGRISASLQTFSATAAYTTNDVVIGPDKKIWRAKNDIAEPTAGTCTVGANDNRTACEGRGGVWTVTGTNSDPKDDSTNWEQISASVADTTYTAGDGLDLTGTVFSTDIKADSGLQITGTNKELDLNLSASGITGTLDETDGGTGLTSYATGDIMYASGANVLAKLTKGTNGQVLKMGGSNIPTWATDNNTVYTAGDGLDLTGTVFSTDIKADSGLQITGTNKELDLNLSASGITGTLDETDGGTGLTSYATGDIMYASGANVLAKLTKGTNGQVLKMGGSNIPTWATDNNTVYTAGDGLDLTGTVFSTDIKADSGLQITGTNKELDLNLSASGITGTLDETDGGTGLTSYATGDIMYASGANVLAKLTKGTNGQVLKMGGSNIPTWATDNNTVYTAGDGLDLTGTVFSTDIKADSGLQITGTNKELDLNLSASGITGTLDETDGGTGLTSYATGDIMYASGANVLAKLTKGTNGQVLKMGGSNIPTWATDNNTVYTAGDGLDLTGTVFSTDIKADSGLQITGTNKELDLNLSASGITGTLDETDGGTGLTSYATGDIMYASGANVLAKLTKGTNGQVLKMGGSNIPTWATDNNTVYTAGTGIGLSTTTFSVAGGTSITADADGVSVTDAGIGTTQLTDGGVTAPKLGDAVVNLEKIAVDQMLGLVFDVSYTDDSNTSPTNGDLFAATTAGGTTRASNGAWDLVKSVRVSVKDSSGLFVGNVLDNFVAGESYIKLSKDSANQATFKVTGIVEVTTGSLNARTGYFRLETNDVDSESNPVGALRTLGSFTQGADYTVSLQTQTDAVVDGNLIVTGSISTDAINANSAVFGTLAADTANFNTVVAETATFGSVRADFLNADVIFADFIQVDGNISILAPAAANADHSIQAWSDSTAMTPIVRDWDQGSTVPKANALDDILGLTASKVLDDDGDTVTGDQIGASGFFLGQTTDGPRFFIGDADGANSQFMKWNGTQLIVAGDSLVQLNASKGYYNVFNPGTANSGGENGYNTDGSWSLKNNADTDKDARRIKSSGGVDARKRFVDGTTMQVIFNREDMNGTDAGTSIYDNIGVGSTCRVTRVLNRTAEVVDLRVLDNLRVTNEGETVVTQGRQLDFEWYVVAVTVVSGTPADFLGQYNSNTPDDHDILEFSWRYFDEANQGIELGSILGSNSYGTHVVLGENSLADNTGSIVALGRDAKGLGSNSIAIGNKSEAGVQTVGTSAGDADTGDSAIAIGGNADTGSQAEGDNSIAIGIARATGEDSIYIGRAESSDQANLNAISIGVSSRALGTDSIAIGNTAAVGSDNASTGTGSIAIGNESVANFVNSGAIGNNATARDSNIVTLGGDNGAFTPVEQIVELGRQTDSNDNDLAVVTKLYLENNAGGNDFLVINSTVASGDTAASATGADSIAIGEGASDGGADNVIAIGKDAVTKADFSVEYFPDRLRVGTGTNSGDGSWKMCDWDNLDEDDGEYNDLARSTSRISEEVLTIFIQNSGPVSLGSSTDTGFDEETARIVLMEQIRKGDTLQMTIPATASTSLSSEAVLNMTLKSKPTYESPSSVVNLPTGFGSTDEYWRCRVDLDPQQIAAVTNDDSDNFLISTTSPIGFKLLRTRANSVILGNDQIQSISCNASTISSISDKRDKARIEDLEDSCGLDFINKIQPREFYWDRRKWYDDGVPDGSKITEEKSNAIPNSGKQMGFIAQEVEAIIEGNKILEDSNLVTGQGLHKEMSYGALVTPLVKAVQQLSTENDALKARLDALENL